jgi:uroporphyrin-III C-methyltransferase
MSHDGALGEPPGTVYVVGAGPGDPDLMTVKARRLLDAADVVLHDALVGDGVVETLPDDAEVVDVGKSPGGEGTPQEAINERLVRESRRGRTVVRLKGGDPTVFGRGGEEAEHLAAGGVPFEFVPGVTSAVAGPESAGIPLTHRAHASALAVVTGHEDPTKDESALDWSALGAIVDAGGTLVVLMGVGRLPDNVAALRDAGVDADTPAAMVERATLAEEFAVTGTLGTIAERARETGVEPPAVTVVGDVVDVGERVRTALGGAALREDTGLSEGVPLPEAAAGVPAESIEGENP